MKSYLVLCNLVNCVVIAVLCMQLLHFDRFSFTNSFLNAIVFHFRSELVQFETTTKVPHIGPPLIQHLIVKVRK